MAVTAAPIDAGSPAYWREQKTALALLSAARTAYDAMKAAPLYRYRYHDENGDEVFEENLAPHDAFSAACRAVEASPRAMAIYKATGCPKLDMWLEIPF